MVKGTWIYDDICKRGVGVVRNLALGGPCVCWWNPSSRPRPKAPFFSATRKSGESWSCQRQMYRFWTWNSSALERKESYSRRNKKKIWFIDKFFVWWSSYEMNLNKRDEHFLGIVMCSHWSIGYLETSKQPAVQKDLDQLYTIKRSWSRITWFVTSWVCHCCFSITFYGSKGVCPNIKTMAAFAETFMSHRMLAREEDILVVANFGFRNLAFHLGIRSNNIYHNLYLYDILLYGLLFS